MAEEKKKRTPRNADSILEGALKLSLKERVSLSKAIKESIDKELSEMAKQYEEAKQIVGKEVHFAS